MYEDFVRIPIAEFGTPEHLKMIIGLELSIMIQQPFSYKLPIGSAEMKTLLSKVGRSFVK